MQHSPASIHAGIEPREENKIQIEFCRTNGVWLYIISLYVEAANYYFFLRFFFFSPFDEIYNRTQDKSG